MLISNIYIIVIVNHNVHKNLLLRTTVGTVACACLLQNRPIILPRAKRTLCVRHRYAMRSGAICARSLECKHSDLASLDYVAFGSTGRCGLRPHPSWSTNKNKEEITARAISSLLVDQLGLDSRANCALGLPRL